MSLIYTNKRRTFFFLKVFSTLKAKNGKFLNIAPSVFIKLSRNPV